MLFTHVGQPVCYNVRQNGAFIKQMAAFPWGSPWLPAGNGSPDPRQEKQFFYLDLVAAHIFSLD